jgi:hypothetical protein
MQAFFTLAAVSPNRQRSFRGVVIAHLVMLLILIAGMIWYPTPAGPVLFGEILLVAGIVEGALLIGWRLSQIPKSQALEFLLVSAVRPSAVLLGEAAVCLTFLLFTTLAGLPILVLMAGEGLIHFGDLPVLLAMPLIYGAVTGLGLTTWAYETQTIRRWGERLGILGVLVYLVVGVLAGERLGDWLSGLPSGWGPDVVAFLRLLHEYNPFGAMQFAMEQPAWAWSRVAWVLSLGIIAAILLLIRSALRLHGHYNDEHYRPRPVLDERRRLPGLADPLTWWAVKRVSRYSGRINVYLAGGFGLLYAAYSLAGEHWPIWLGHAVFEIFDRVGGLPMLATALMLLATVPAAFQYGLWDSNAQDRSRRLELLLMTDLDGHSYWQAATAAAWHRSRAYFLFAVILWLAAAGSGRITWTQAFAGISAGVILWGFYFTLGFRAFTRGTQATQLGLVLTMLLPLATCLLAYSDWSRLAILLPPGSVYFGSTESPNFWWMIGPLTMGVMTLLTARSALLRCVADLHFWYDGNHGVNVV